MSLLTDEQKERMRKATALRVLKDMSPSEIDETLQSLKDKLDAVEQELQDSKDARVTLALTVMKLQERWWPFVHGAVCASDTARNLLHEANNAISDYQPILTKYNLEQQANGLDLLALSTSYPDDSAGDSADFYSGYERAISESENIAAQLRKQAGEL